MEEADRSELNLLCVPAGPPSAVNEQGTLLIDRLSQARFAGIPFAARKQELRTTETFFVQDVLQMLQGHPSKSFTWDESDHRFHFKLGVHLSHLSQCSLNRLVQRFVSAASSLRRVGEFVKRVTNASSAVTLLHLQAPPTLQAFASAVSLRLEHLHKAALERELLAEGGGAGTTVTLLSLFASLSWVCAGAEFLEQVVNEAIPHRSILCEGGVSAGELGAHILSYLHNKMSNFCLLQDGEGEPYGTLLMLFSGSLQPLIQSLDLWLHEGILDDPFGEMFFHINSSVAIEDSAFWQHGFYLRHFKSHHEGVCDSQRSGSEGIEVNSPGPLQKEFINAADSNSHFQNGYQETLMCANFLQPIAKAILSAGKSLQLLRHVNHRALDHLSSNELTSAAPSFLPVVSVKSQKGLPFIEKNEFHLQAPKDVDLFGSIWQLWGMSGDKHWRSAHSFNEKDLIEPETLGYKGFQEGISFPCDVFQPRIAQPLPGLALSSALPPLNDEETYKAVCACETIPSATKPLEESLPTPIRNYNREKYSAISLKGTDYGNGTGCGNLLVKHANSDLKAMNQLFRFPTFLPSSEEGLFKHPTPQSRVVAVMFDWLQKAELKVTPLPQILVQECFINSIQKQVEAVGKLVLNKLMGEWRLMEELSILRAIYLIGSGDLLQQFSSVLFNKLDRGEPWDDFYELNTMLQESVRSSADGLLLPALDSLVVNVQPSPNSGMEQGPGPASLHIAGRNPTFGIDTLDNLFFVYKVSWPLELIIDKGTIRKYNQVMGFLFKVKRAKFALDKACRWMWKNGGGDHTKLKQQLLLQQQLMHFVNTLHQYIMDRVLYSAWMELCEQMASARSLDEVIACHDAYLVSIQRQCLVAPDKLWALISSRVKTILGLALEFYSIQRTLCSGGAAPAVKSRCLLEIERVGRQFDECIVFLLRVLSFKLNVGHFPHLAELVTRINYNYYYMSESGHLLTPLPEIIGGKGFQQAKLAMSGPR